MHFRSFSFRNKDKKAKSKTKSAPPPLSEEEGSTLTPESTSSSLSPPVLTPALDPFAHHVHLPPTSIANLVLDPDNLTALYHTAEGPSDGPGSAGSERSASREDGGGVAHSPSESDGEGLVEVVAGGGSGSYGLGTPSPSESHHQSSQSQPHHHPKTSISELVFNGATLSALYEARDAERKAGNGSGVTERV
ncbi:hypothetical protein GYMLUDRAFT_43520 [Collybiopsis luxurians FD-317 M1]|uniref:Uncharacterized protein n=1 Tax=Collybiopsis luxurians FD-317 M1 TaxID=944289 RepID=A0A0D0BYT1_9AGAR|nr:hypothetical protein GYMLUDRAFT_43520 [Collybiopsis luxurians FD-317 M1]